MLKVGVLKPVHEATPWINSFVLVEGEDKLRNLKLRICLDPTNLNKAIVRESYHFKTLEDIAHLLADACIVSMCNCKKGYWHQELDEVSSFLTTFNTELGRFKYTVMPFGGTVAGDVFQHKPDQCFGHLKNVIVIADDIIIVGKMPNHSDMIKHGQPCLKLLGNVICDCTMKSSNIRSKRYNFLVKHTLQVITSLIQTKSQPLPRCLPIPIKSKYNPLLG